MKRIRARAVSVDERGFVTVDGVKLGKRVVKDGIPKLQVADKDRRRSAERGTRLVEVSVEELGEALRDGRANLAQEGAQEGIESETLADLSINEVLAGAD